MTALVTGASGVVGQPLVNRLRREGYHVRALARNGLKGRNELDVDIIHGDVRDMNAVKQAARECDLIYHLAAEVHGCDVTRARLWATNVEGTANVARAALECGVKRLVYTSSVSVYGRRVSRHNLDETSDTRPDSSYAASKLEAERILLENRQLPVVVVRPAMVLGEGASSWVEFFRTIAAGRFRMMGPGKGLHSLTDPGDLADGLLRCGTTPGIEGRVFVMAGCETVSLKALIDMIADELGAQAMGKPQHGAPLIVYAALDRALYGVSGLRLPKADRADLFLSDRSFDISRAKAELGYEPKVPAREIIRRTISWMRSERLLDGAAA